MAFILTKPNSTSSLQSVLDGGIIPNNSTLTIDSLGLIETDTIKWIIELIDNTNQKIRSFEILAVNKFDIDVSFNKYGISGESILHDVSIVVNGSNIDLNITNNEAVNLNYKFARIQL